MKMKKTHLILVLLFAFAVLTCTSGVASAITSLQPQYVGNTMVDLKWTQYGSADFSKYELCRDGSPIATITDRSTTFYRNTGLTKDVTYIYKISVYNATGGLQFNTTTKATTGEVHGTITQDTTWTAASSPYIILHAGAPSLVRVFNGATLTIESEVKVINYGITVGGWEGQKGVLYADGSSFYDCGITVYDEAHAEIKNCSFEDKGISLYSSYNNITGNTVYNSAGSGISLSSSDYNNITGNTVYNSAGSGIYLYSSSYNILTDNTAYNNAQSGISLGSSSYNNITGNTADFNSGRGISLGSSSYNNITGNTCNWNLDGIELYSSSNNILTDNTAYINDQCGIFLWKSSSNTLTDNTAYNNPHYGIELCSSSNNMLTGNTAYNNSLSGISLSSSSNNMLTSNTANSNNNFGIELYSSDYNTLTSNTANSNSDYGIYLTFSSSNNVVVDNVANSNGQGINLCSSSSNNVITGNTASNNIYCGISLYDSSNNVITGNFASNHKYNGIYLSSSNDNDITDNFASDNVGCGIILLSSSSNNVISDNTVSNNGDGIGLSYSSNNDLTDNTVSNSDQGIYLVSSSDYNTIYNNYFNNTDNAYDDGSNIWNIAKTSGTNIVYGPYLGGNYWSDYTGVDADGDGIGDTPHNISGGTNKDYLPLAGFIDLWIDDIKIIQTVEDAEQSLVASKPTMVRVFVNGSIIKTKLKLILDGKEIETKVVTIKEQRWYKPQDKKTGKNSVNFFIPQSKNFATKGQHTVKAIINPDNNPPESNRDNNSKIKSCYVKAPKSKFEVEFVALNVGVWDTMNATELQSYRASATENSNFLKAVYPVSDQSYKAHIGTQYEPGTAGTTWFQAIFRVLHRKAAASKNIDRVVGMCPEGWLGPAGASKGLGWDGVIVEEGTGHYFVAAHEIMHTYGKYCGKKEDYLVHSPYGSLADDGWWVEKKDDGCRVNIGTDRKEYYEDFGYSLYFTYMADDNPYDWWTIKSDYEFLYGKLVSSTTTSSHESYPIVKASDSSSKLILLSGLIWSNGSVTIDPIYSGDFLDSE